MANLTFHPVASFDNSLVQDLAKHGAGDYMTDADGTHAAFTDLGEVAVIYPCQDYFVMLVFKLDTAAEYVRSHKLQDAAKDEDAEQAIIEARYEMADPDENEINADEYKTADNGDGTLTFKTSASLF